MMATLEPRSHAVVSRWIGAQPFQGGRGQAVGLSALLLISDANRTVLLDPSATRSFVGRSFPGAHSCNSKGEPLLPMPFGLRSGCPRCRLASVKDRSP